MPPEGSDLIFGHRHNAADRVRVQHRGHCKDFGHARGSAVHRELRQPRTRTDGEARHGEQPEPLRARANTRRYLCGSGWVRDVAVMGADVGDLRRCMGTAARPGHATECAFSSDLSQGSVGGAAGLDVGPVRSAAGVREAGPGGLPRLDLRPRCCHAPRSCPTKVDYFHCRLGASCKPCPSMSCVAASCRPAGRRRSR